MLLKANDYWCCKCEKHATTFYERYPLCDEHKVNDCCALELKGKKMHNFLKNLNVWRSKTNPHTVSKMTKKELEDIFSGKNKEYWTPNFGNWKLEYYGKVYKH